MAKKITTRRMSTVVAVLAMLAMLEATATSAMIAPA
jgi:hypothetical protein